MSKIPQLARDVPDPSPPPTPVKTLTRWAQFLGAVAAGEGIPESKMKYYITNADIEAVTRNDPLEMQRYRDARTAGRKSKWSIMQIEEFFSKIAEGLTIQAAQVAVTGSYDPSLGQLLIEDSDLYTQYKRALEARSLSTVEGVLEVIKDRSRDTLDGPKGGQIPNMAAVSRDKLIAETTLRVVGAWNSKLYGEKKDNVQVNVQINHAETLEAARTREKLRDKRVTPAQMQAAIDATFSEKPVDNDTSWMDEQPADAQWREEK
jgi:hypothetical protein